MNVLIACSCPPLPAPDLSGIFRGFVGGTLPVNRGVSLVFPGDYFRFNLKSTSTKELFLNTVSRIFYWGKDLKFWFSEFSYQM